MLAALVRDMRFGVRQLVRQPGFATVAILSLASGIGLNTTLFSVVNAVLFRGGPIHTERLVEVYSGPNTDLPHLTVSYPDYLDMRRDAPAFSGLAAHGFVRGILTAGNQPVLVTGEAVTANYFDVLGVPIANGRAFAEAEMSTAGGDAIVVLSHTLWQERFGGRPVLGTAVTLSSRPYTVIGIAPDGFAGVIPGLVTDFWVPVTMVESLVFSGVQWRAEDEDASGSWLERRGIRWLFVKGRLAEGATVEEARTQLRTIAARLTSEYPVTNTDMQVAVLPSSGVRFHPMLDGYVQAASAGLFVAVGFVLLIACANVANLMLARGAARRRELAIRAAIGAGRGTLVRQMLAEGLVLAAAGGALGLLIAWWAGRALSGMGTDLLPVPVRFEFAIDPAVFGFALAVSLATALLFALLPALSASKPDLVPALRGVSDSDSRSRFGPRNMLVVGQLALSLVLLSCGALLARGLFVAQRADLGFDPGNVARLAFNLQMNGYDVARATAFRDRALDALRALPGVEAVSTASRLPLSPDISMSGIHVPGLHASPDDETMVDVVSAGPDYFQAVGVPIVSGRGFTVDDIEGRRRVAVINETMARTLWPKGNALGSRFHTDGPSSPPYEVIGIARDHKVRSVGEPPRPYLHLPAGPSRQLGLIVRTSQPAATQLAALTRTVLALEPNIVFTETVTADDIAAATMAPTRIGATIVGAFGLLALVLAAVGLYGVISYGVSRRTRELGVRMAIGASRAEVMRLVLSQGLRLALVGIVPGAIGAAAAGRLLESMLYGVSAADPIALGAAAGLLLLVAAAANLFPARAAARVDPLRALRSE